MPSPSKVYREKGNDSDDDDLDDLDDVLASFNAPSPAKPPASQPVAGPSKPRQSTTSPTVEDADDEFDESLARGMESLLLQLAGTNPPGPMPDTKPKAKTAGLNAKTNDKLMGIPEGEKSGQMSAEEEEKAWQKAIEMMLSGEGLEALGLDKEGNAQAGPSRPPPTLPNAPRGDFDETIRQTMEQLKSAGTAGKSPTDDASLAALLAQLGSDPSALDGLGDGDDELGGLLDGMMAQLMTREVLEEPMAELASKYPAYLASPPDNITPTELEKYRKQSTLVSSIVSTFQKPNYADEKDGKDIARLVSEMQDLGGPPKEIMGDLPEGFDLGALGGDEGCTIM